MFILPPNASHHCVPHHQGEQQVGRNGLMSLGLVLNSLENQDVFKIPSSLLRKRASVWGLHFRMSQNSEEGGYSQGREEGFCQVGWQHHDIYTDVNDLYFVLCLWDSFMWAPLRHFSTEEWTAPGSRPLTPLICCYPIFPHMHACTHARTNLPSQSFHLHLYLVPPSGPWSPPLSAPSPRARSSEGTVWWENRDQG